MLPLIPEIVYSSVISSHQEGLSPSNPLFLTIKLIPKKILLPTDLLIRMFLSNIRIPFMYSQSQILLLAGTLGPSVFNSNLFALLLILPAFVVWVGLENPNTQAGEQSDKYYQNYWFLILTVCFKMPNYSISRLTAPVRSTLKEGKQFKIQLFWGTMKAKLSLKNSIFNRKLFKNEDISLQWCLWFVYK